CNDVVAVTRPPPVLVSDFYTTARSNTARLSRYFSTLRRSLWSTFFPYTTLFRSRGWAGLDCHWRARCQQIRRIVGAVRVQSDFVLSGCGWHGKCQSGTGESSLGRRLRSVQIEPVPGDVRVGGAHLSNADPVLTPR